MNRATKYLNVLLVLAIALALRVSYGSGTSGGLQVAGGFPTRVAAGRSVAVTNAAAGTVVTYAVPSDGTFQIIGEIYVVSGATWTLNTRINYTDENNVVRNVVPSQYNDSTGWNFSTNIGSGTNSAGKAFGFSAPYNVRIKGGTTLTVTETGGVYTAIVYNIEVTVIQVS